MILRAERDKSNITTPVKTRLSFEEFVTIFGPIMSLLDPKYFVCLKEQEELIEAQNSSSCQFSLMRLMKCVLSLHCAFSVLEYVFLYIDGCPEIGTNRDVTAFKNFLEDPFSGLSASFKATIPGSPEAMEMEIVEDIVELIRLIETVRKVLLKYLSVNERMEKLIKFCEQAVKVRKELEKYEKEFWFYVRCEKARKTCFDAHSKGRMSYRSLYLYDMVSLKPKRGTTAKLTPKTKSDDPQRAEKSTQSMEEQRNIQAVQHTFAERREQFWLWYNEYVNSWTMVDISSLCNSLKYGDKEKLNMPTDPADSYKWFTALHSLSYFDNLTDTNSSNTARR
ncbi:hypothetical protein THOM_2720 [Trachipleistophora hominis]|uniref:Uncharacterized protein n=1 Tax=Trachipleistophora hominis TaxID=72359 RepID=L7JUD3_TRAHO|nr:hypothetical protein THOM_2720 [Trachipleistophora hominis]